MDPISDILTRINNAQKAGHESIEMPASKAKFELAKILQREGFLTSVDEKKGKNNKKKLILQLKYLSGQPAITGIKRISKPGCRIYIAADKIRSVRQGYGRAIISTSRGLMTDKEARKNRLGGEVICEIY